MNATSVHVTGRTVFAWLMAAFLIVATVNIAMIIFAVGSFSGETEGKSYAAGLNYNRTLADVARQQALGWRVSGGVSSAADGLTHVAITFVDAEGHPLTDLETEATFIRPTNAGQDFSIALASQGGGLYTGAANPQLPGRWHVRIVAKARGEPPFIVDFAAGKP